MNPTATPAPNAANMGRYHRFGPLGPAYEVLEPLQKLDDGDWLMRIVVLESGQQSEYRASKIRQDPEA